MSITRITATPNICTFCRIRVREKRNQSESDKAAILIRTLCQAANIPNFLLSPTSTHKNYWHCSTCDKILSEIATHYTQLQAHLRSIKSIILQHFNPQNTQESHFLLRQTLVKDLNPCLILIKQEEEQGATTSGDDVFDETIQIKQEVIDHVPTEVDGDEDFGAILPDDDHLLDVDIDPLRPDDVDEEDPDFKPAASPSSSTSWPKSPPPFKPRRRTPRRRPHRLSRAIHRPHKPRGKNRPKVPIPYDESDMKLTPGLDGSYTFCGVTMSLIPNPDNPSLSRSKRNTLGHFKCELCGRVTRGLYNLKVHVRRVHLRIEHYDRHHVKIQGERVKLETTPEGTKVLHGIAIVKNEDGRYPCSSGSCPRIFTTRHRLLLHIRHTHAKIPKVIRPVFGPETEEASHKSKSIRTDDNRVLFCGVEMLNLPNGKFGCGQCPIERKHRASIFQHIKIHHPESRPHTCPEPGCGFSTAYKHLLEQHVVVHRVDKPFICDKCGVTFKRKSALQEHNKRVHLKVVNAVCPHCGKGFYTRKDLRQHSRVHEKEYQ